MTNGTSGSGNRIVCFLRPRTISGTPQQSNASDQTSRLDWKAVAQTFNQFGVQVHEECSAAVPGFEHAEIVVQGTIKDYSQITPLVQRLLQNGWMANIQPYFSPYEYTKLLGGSQPVAAGTR